MRLLKMKKEQSRKEDKDPLMVERGLRLKAVRKALRFSRPALQRKYGIKPSTLKNWEDGRFGGLRESSAWQMIEIFTAEGLECTIEWLLLGIGTPPLPDLFPEETPTKAEEIRFIQEELRVFRKNYADTVDMIISDNTMRPAYSLGDYVAGIRYYEKDFLSVVSGRLCQWPCIVQTRGGETLIRLVEKGSQEGYYRLHTLTASSEEIPLEIELFSIAPILWIRRKNPLAE
jgi:DNA-binding transcriptional regulator YiaG